MENASSNLAAGSIYSPRHQRSDRAEFRNKLFRNYTTGPNRSIQRTDSPLIGESHVLAGDSPESLQGRGTRSHRDGNREVDARLPLRCKLAAQSGEGKRGSVHDALI